ncbi:MAG TPA: ABC transporter ATP-binding protein [Spirochaetota bacterium]|nr:ABC transporter ATP-binding protein [Spirochaetota bacterium]HOD13978.1 ABC transporter ATP-binding protein [Spirochaetota bacterium]HPG52209.1 ABC transporter ATP-binding protein [Spirochaetota bacterium]HPN13147.1 ABC transporter ATP-binding protein [Spirochaetota bacterium]
MSFLTIQGLSRSFGGLRAVDDVSFSVERNMIKAVIGPNGAGKTTLFNLISGALAPDSGEVAVDGSPIQGRPPYRIARRGISRTFQNIKLFTHMSVLENVMIGRHIRTRAGFVQAMLRLPGARREEREIREKSMDILKLLGIDDLAGQEASSLPFGKQRIVEFARALATEPVLLLLDEPAAGLNIYETAHISDMITTIRERGVTVLVIEHDMSLVMNISDEITVLSSGKKIAEGVPSEIQRNPEVIRVYLGEEDA